MLSSEVLNSHVVQHDKREVSSWRIIMFKELLRGLQRHEMLTLSSKEPIEPSKESPHILLTHTNKNPLNYTHFLTEQFKLLHAA